MGRKDIRSHIDAVHASPPGSDKYTGDIVEGIINEINCSGIISTVSRREVDLNRLRDKNNKEAIDEYRNTIRKILAHLNILDEAGELKKPYLHLAIHGMKDEWGKDIIIGTLHNKSCSQEIKDWFVQEIEKYIKNVQVEGRFPGNPSKSVHRLGDKLSDLSYLGYGRNFNTFQIEINRTLRQNHQKELTEIFSEIISRFNENW